ncbi:hypothetical protein NSZ01_31030 [Nocardioides szechwanensis]|nr:hypothetical protein NSZ01_31030 [Nocardioides szechwanensis]
MVPLKAAYDDCQIRAAAAIMATGVAAVTAIFAAVVEGVRMVLLRWGVCPHPLRRVTLSLAIRGEMTRPVVQTTRID